MKILYLTNHLKPGGITSYVLDLACHFKARGHEVWVASAGVCPARLQASKVSHLKLPLHTSAELNPGALYAAWKLRAFLRSQAIDVVHAQTRVTQVVSSLATPPKTHRITTCHGYFKRRFFRTHWPLWGDCVIAISPAVERHLSGDWNLSPAKITRILHGIQATDLKQNGRAQYRRELGIPEGTFAIGALGRLSPVKGYDILIEAVAKLKAAGRNQMLCLAGSGPHEPQLKRLVAKHALGEQVKFLTNIQNKAQFYKAVDVFCAPSRAEGFGLSILEAMSHGQAVLASCVGGVPSLIEHGECGWLVSPDNASELAAALLELRRQPALLTRFRERALAKSRSEFGLERMLNETEAVYRETIALAK